MELILILDYIKVSLMVIYFTTKCSGAVQISYKYNSIMMDASNVMNCDNAPSDNTFPYVFSLGVVPAQYVSKNYDLKYGNDYCCSMSSDLRCFCSSYEAFEQFITGQCRHSFGDLPFWLKCDDDVDIAYVPKVGPYKNNFFFVEGGSLWHEFFQKFGNTRSLDVIMLPTYFVQYLIPHAQALFNINAFSLDSEVVIASLTSVVEKFFLSQAISDLKLISKSIGFILQAVSVFQNPSTVSVASFIYNLFLSFDVSLKLVSMAVSSVSDAISYITNMLMPRAQALEDFVDFLPHIASIVVTLISVIGLSALPAKSMIVDIIKYAGILARSFVSVKVMIASMGDIINDVIDWAYIKLFGVPRTMEAFGVLEREVSIMMDEINDLCTISDMNRLREDQDLRLRIRDAKVNSYYLQRQLMCLKIDIAGIRYFHTACARLEKLAEKAELHCVVGDGPRPEPLVLHFFGPSGVGKSHVPYFVATDIMHSEGYSDIMNRVYYRNVEQEFWDGYTHSKKVVVYDDFGQKVDQPSVPNPEFMELIRSGNIAAWPLHMAALTEKANTYFRSSAIILTSNEKHYNIQSLTHSEAFHRRIDLRFKLEVDDAYLNAFGGIDEDKVVTKLGKRCSEKIYKFVPYLRSGTSLSPTYTAQLVKDSSGNMVPVQLDYEEMIKVVISLYKKKQIHSQARLDAIYDRASVLKARDEVFVDANDALPTAQVLDMSANETFLATYWVTGGNVSKYYEFLDSIDLRVCALSSDDMLQFIETAVFRRIQLQYKCISDPESIVENGMKYLPPFVVRDTEKSGIILKNLKAYMNKVEWKEVAKNIAALSVIAGAAALVYRLLFSTAPKQAEAFVSGDHITNHLPVARVESCVISDVKTSLASSEHKVSGEQITHKMPIARTELMDTVVKIGDDVVNIGEKNLQPYYLDVENMHDAQAYVDTNAQEIIQNCLISNIYRIGGVGGKFCANIMFIAGRVAMCNWHVVDHLKQYTSINLRNPYLQSGYTFEWDQINIVDLDRNDFRDVVLLIFPRSLVSHRNILKQFVTSEDISHFKSSKGVLVGIHNDAKDRMLVKVQPLNMEAKDSFDYLYGNKNKILHVRTCYKYEAQVGAGDCGSVLLLNSTAIPRKLCGIHIAGDKGRGYSTSITRELLGRALAEIPAEVQIGFALHDTVDTLARSQCSVQGEFIHLGKNSVVGSCPTKTDIAKSKLYGLIAPVTCAPSVLSPTLVDGQLIDPLLVGIQKCGGPYVEVEADVRDIAKESVIASVIANADQSHQRILSYEEAITGTSDIFINPINRRSSAGYGWSDKTKGKVGKTKWLGDGDYILDNVELKNAVLEREQLASQGIRAPHLWVDTLKVERRPLLKVQNAQTRVFSVGQIDYILLCRKYFLGFCAHLMHNRISNGIAVGINPYSYEWTELARHLQSKGTCVVAGDYKNFDGCNQKDDVELTYEVYIAFMSQNREEIEKVMPWDRFLIISRVLFDDMSNSIHLCRDMVLQYTHSNPSGGVLTTAINCVSNKKKLRECYVKIIKKAALVDPSVAKYLLCYNELVAETVFGDDHVLNIHDCIIEYFNQHTIAETMKELGMTYTDETKKGGVAAYRTLSEVTFLKRGFIYNGARCDAPLSLDTCLEMVNWIRGTLDTDELTITNVETACKELSLHSEEVFDYWTTLIRRRCYEVGLFPEIHSYKAYRLMLFLSQGGGGYFINDE